MNEPVKLILHKFEKKKKIKKIIVIEKMYYLKRIVKGGATINNINNIMFTHVNV